ncbi:MAG: hypothetical protein ABWY55_10905 [Microbacterium sp.]
MSGRFPLLLAAVALTLAVTACAPGAGGSGTSPSAASAPPAPSESSSPTPSAAEASIPADCSEVGSAATRAATVDQLNLQGDGTDFVRPAPAGAVLALGCDWFAGDATGVLLLVSEVDPTEAEAFATTLPGMGYTCEEGSGGGDVCTMTTPNSQYPVDTVETIVLRDGVWFYLATTNVDGTALLADLESAIWSS